MSVDGHRDAPRAEGLGVAAEAAGQCIPASRAGASLGEAVLQNLIPVAADQHLLTACATGYAPVPVMDVAGVDVVQALVQGDAPRPGTIGDLGVFSLNYH